MTTPNENEKQALDEFKDERGVLPPINQIGVDLAGASGLRDLVKAQLKHVHDEIVQYVPMKPRGWGDDNQMPHEWGSMDSYDDMRNSLHVATELMDRMCDPLNPIEDPKEEVHRILSEGGVCAVAKELIDFVGGTDAQWAWEEKNNGRH